MSAENLNTIAYPLGFNTEDRERGNSHIYISDAYVFARNLYRCFSVDRCGGDQKSAYELRTYRSVDHVFACDHFTAIHSVILR